MVLSIGLYKSGFFGNWSCPLTNIQPFLHLVDEAHIDHLVVRHWLLENACIEHDRLAGCPDFWLMNPSAL